MNSPLSGCTCSGSTPDAAMRESLIQQLATASGKIGALEVQIESLERRAVGAETRLEKSLKRPTAAKKKAEKPRQQELIKR